MTQEPGKDVEQRKERTRDGLEGKRVQNHSTSFRHYANGRTPRISAKHHGNVPGPKSSFPSSQGKHILSLSWTKQINKSQTQKRKGI